MRVDTNYKNQCGEYISFDTCKDNFGNDRVDSKALVKALRILAGKSDLRKLLNVVEYTLCDDITIRGSDYNGKRMLSLRDALGVCKAAHEHVFENLCYSVTLQYNDTDDKFKKCSKSIKVDCVDINGCPFVSVLEFGKVFYKNPVSMWHAVKENGYGTVVYKCSIAGEKIIDRLFVSLNDIKSFLIRHSSVRKRVNEEGRGFLYIFDGNDKEYLKIGRAVNLKKRLHFYQGGHFKPVSFLLTISVNNTIAAEEYIKNKLGSVLLKRSGQTEWFKRSDLDKVIKVYNEVKEIFK